MSASARKTSITPEEYLALDSAAEVRSEYYDGAMYAMSGASIPHNRLNLNLARALGNQLEGGPCEVFTNDLRVGVREGAFVYPDLVVVCGEPQLRAGQFTTLLNPLVIIEVLSPSNQGWDRGGKFIEYQRIVTLRHYILVHQAAPTVELHDRQPDGIWTRTEIAWPDGVLTLASLGVMISIREIYARVFPPDRPA